MPAYCVRAAGIVQSDFKIKSMDFTMFDVGGQRNERRKWIHAFDDVNCMIFVSALSEYDQVGSRVNSTRAAPHNVTHRVLHMPPPEGSL